MAAGVMNKQLTVWFMAFLVLACTNEKTYKLTIYKRSSTGKVVAEEKEIKAVNDSAAYDKASLTFKVHTDVYNSLGDARKYLDTPTGYTLYDDKYTNVESILSSGLIDKIKARYLTKMEDSSEVERYDSAEQAKVFGKISFGMSRSQVDKLDEYSYKIGKYDYYSRESYTDSDSLYLYELYSLPHDASRYDGQVRSEWENLVDVITNKYGNADDADSYPSFFRMKNGYITFTHEWEIGKKAIRIGIGEDDSRYYAVCRITDDRLQQRVENAANDKTREMQNKDAEKF
jgi:hypothetical protein